MSDDDIIDNEDLKVHKVKVLLQDPKALAKQRLMDFANSLPVSEDGYYDEQDNYIVTHKDGPMPYLELLEHARNYQETGEYLSEGSRFEGTSLYAGFWDDYKLVTGLPVTDTYSFFSCSC